MRAGRCSVVAGVVVCVLVIGLPSARAMNILIADDLAEDGMDFLDTALMGHAVTHLDNTDASGDPVYTEDADFLGDFDVVIFYGSGDRSIGRAITAAEHSALEEYIQGGGSLIVTGYDVLGDPDDPLLADVVRSSTFGDDTDAEWWTAADIDHFVLNGPFGDFRGESIQAVLRNHDQLTADASRGALALGLLEGSAFAKIIFTDVAAPGGSVGMWNGNDAMADWDPVSPEGEMGLAILRNWLAGLGDADGDGVFDADDNCPGTAAGDPVGADGCSTADDDGDGVRNDADDCPDTAPCATVGPNGCLRDSDGDGVVDGCEPSAQSCCGGAGPVAPLGSAIGLLLLSRFTGHRSTRRR